MADQNVEEQNVDNDVVEPGKGGDVIDVMKDGQAAGDDHAGDVSVKDADCLLYTSPSPRD